MNSNVLKLFAAYMVFLITGCENDDVTKHKGMGSIIYDGTVYPLNYLTLATTENDDGTYNHVFVVTYTEKGNDSFRFSIKDNHSENDVSTGSYDVTIEGGHIAHFLIKNVSDSLTGIIKVIKSDDNYTFHFEGSMVDENNLSKEIVFNFTGKANREG